jgi:hypothetical protein
MKKLYKVLAMRCIAIIAIVAVIGFSFAACDDGGGGGGPGNDGGGGGGGGGGGSGLIGKWYATQETANSRAEWAVCYEFKSNGELLVAGTDMDCTYKASGGQLTMTIMGYPAGSANYNISGTELTISNAGDSGWADGTYYKPR